MSRTDKRGAHNFYERMTMMEFIEIFKDLVSNLGVPVACLVVTFKLWQKETESHKQSEDKMTEAINNNTVALNKLVDRMDTND